MLHLLIPIFPKRMPVKNVYSRALSRLRKYLATESPLKIIKKNLFHPKDLFILKKSKFLNMQKNGLIRKISLISKFMTSQRGNYCNIFRSKGNQTMKFGRLLQYNMRNIFLEKSHTKCGGLI